MTRTLNDLRADELGERATAADLAEFCTFCRRAINRRLATTEEEAMDLVWGTGDYLRNARRLGLDE